MKGRFTFLLLITAGLLHAQSYQQIISSGVSTYYNPIEKAYHCLRFDTVTALGGGDTMYTSYKTYRMVTSVCLTDSGGSLLGPKVIKRQNGLFFF
jgi:hypothetical protein